MVGGRPLDEVIAEWERNKGVAAAAEAASQAAAEAELDAMAAAMFAEDADAAAADAAVAPAAAAPAATTEATATSTAATGATTKAKGSARRSSKKAPAVAPPPDALFSAGWSVGIDLGTTNSAVAAMVHGKPTVLLSKKRQSSCCCSQFSDLKRLPFCVTQHVKIPRNRTLSISSLHAAGFQVLSHPKFHGGGRTVPSVVAFGPGGAILIGHAAANKRRGAVSYTDAVRDTANPNADSDSDAGDGTTEGDSAGSELGGGDCASDWAVYSSIKRVIGRSVAEARQAGEDLGLLGVAPEPTRLKHLLLTAKRQQLAATAAEATRVGGLAAAAAPVAVGAATHLTAAVEVAAAAVAVKGKGAEPVVLACRPRALAALAQAAATAATAAATGAGTAAPAATSSGDTGCLLPEEVSAEVVRSLLAAAKAALEDLNLPPPGASSSPRSSSSPRAAVHIPRAVITVPAYFTPAQCAATERAGLAAGLQRVRLLKEPEAAALAYGLGTNGVAGKENELVLVFDLGGGTLDVSVLEVGGGGVGGQAGAAAAAAHSSGPYTHKKKHTQLCMAYVDRVKCAANFGAIPQDAKRCRRCALGI
jgi:molecular chaperone DnaK